MLDEMIARHDTGLVFISHDLPLVMLFCDRVAVMYSGRIVETCAARDLAHARHPSSLYRAGCSPLIRRF